MYLMGKSETPEYECDICGFQMKWDEKDVHHGVMWGCEKCEKNFCTNCFVKRHGRGAFDKMIAEGDRVLCPDCFDTPHA